MSNNSVGHLVTLVWASLGDLCRQLGWGHMV